MMNLLTDTCHPSLKSFKASREQAAVVVTIQLPTSSSLFLTPSQRLIGKLIPPAEHLWRTMRRSRLSDLVLSTCIYPFGYVRDNVAIFVRDFNNYYLTALTLRPASSDWKHAIAHASYLLTYAVYSQSTILDASAACRRCEPNGTFNSTR